MTLTLCWTGEALTFVGRMGPEKALDYKELKLTLLKRFRYTAEGYRRRFRLATPEERGTRKQFPEWSCAYLDRWLEISKRGDIVESVNDTMLSEQFLCKCHKKFAIFIEGLQNVRVTGYYRRSPPGFSRSAHLL